MPPQLDQMTEFQIDNAWQLRMRDAILVPELYERRRPGAYELIEHDDPRAKGGCDTIVDGWRIDEKIVRWPKPKLGRPEGPYTTYALETMSCSVPGRERIGWMLTNTVHFLLFCFSDKQQQSLDCHMIHFPELQAWFRKHEQEYPLWTKDDERQRTQCRIVPFVDIAEVAKVRRFLVTRQAQASKTSAAEVFYGSQWSCR